MTKLDRIDFRILGALQKNARMSNKELAAAAGLAQSSCHERLKRLNHTGVLRGAHIDVDLLALGYHLQAILMIEVSHEHHDVDSLLDDLEAIPEVTQVALVTGRYDLIVHVIVRDTNHLRDLAMYEFSNRPNVTRFETSIIYEARRNNEIPLEARPSVDRRFSETPPPKKVKRALKNKRGG